MPITLRDYQADMEKRIYDSWTRVKNVLSVLPTGSGKTVLFSEIIRKCPGAVCAIAHRQELVSQISLALARDGVRHKIIGPKSVIKVCIHVQQMELRRNFYDPLSKVAVAGVDTLLRRGENLGDWAKSVTLWIQDEAHHVQIKNKWGKVIALFPNARGLGVTATAFRADGGGLGATSDGVFENLIIGPSSRDLIRQNYLTDYRIFAPDSNLDLSDVPVSAATGDFNPLRLKRAVRRSRIVGDVVDHYLRIAPGKLGITFATDVETAREISNKFNAAGVPADMVCAKTPDRLRIELIRKFRNRELLQIVNVDIFGEGFDLPAIEVVSMARPTESLVLFIQQFGRGLRPMEGKTHAIIIDHVGNIMRHGLPDVPRKWSLDRRERRTQPPITGPLVRVCPQCTSVYERFYSVCPFCGYKPEPVSRSSPEFVDGDLTELDAATLARMRGEIEHFDRSPEVYRSELAAKHAPIIGQMAHVKRFTKQQEAQSALRTSIAWWRGVQEHLGRGESESYRRFYHGFGTDVLSAQVLGTEEALRLAQTINDEIGVLL